MMIKASCERCSQIFEAHSYRARYCSPGCRTAAYRDRKKAKQAAAAEQPTVTPPAEPPSMAARTLAELQKAKVDETSLGRGAIVLAVRIDAFSATDSPSGLVALVKEHAAAMTRALGGVTVDSLDPFDELARRREERRKAAGG